MEADERTVDLLMDTSNPSPVAPPPSRSNSRERRPSTIPSDSSFRSRGTHDRVWRRRPDEEIPQRQQQSSSLQPIPSQQLERGNANDSPQAAIPGGVQNIESTPNYLSSPTVGRVSSPDIDQTSTTSGGTSWSVRIPWLRQQQSDGSRYDVHDDGLGGSPLSFGGSDSTYYRDVMNAYDFMNMREIVGNEPVNDDGQEGFARTTVAELDPRRYSTSIVSSSSHVTSTQSSVSGESSDAELKSTEWTPQDSSYGAACPMCGSLPKRIRRGVELAMIGLVILSLMYLIVTTSIRITNDHSSSHSGSDADVALDDDFYVEWDDNVYNDGYVDSSDEEEESEEENEEEEGDGDGERYLRKHLFRKSKKRRDVWEAPWV